MNLIDRFAADTEVFVRQLLDCNREELLRDMRYLGGCCCQPLNKLFFSVLLSAFRSRLICMAFYLSNIEISFEISGGISRLKA